MLVPLLKKGNLIRRHFEALEEVEYMKIQVAIMKVTLISSNDQRGKISEYQALSTSLSI